MNARDMSSLLRLVELEPSLVSTLSPAPLSSIRPSLRPTIRASLLPTLVPSSRSTLDASRARSTDTPTTQRSATMPPRFEPATRHDAYSLLAAIRLNMDFLESLLGDHTSSQAAEVLADIHLAINRIERSFG